jgi:polysaccharide export outer membrane protein
MKFLPFILMFAIATLCVYGQETPASATPPQQPESITVNVLGAVNKPSKVTMPKGSTVLDALALAGDFNEFAAKSKVKLIHKSAGAKPDATVIDVKAMMEGTEKAATLRDGDTLFVPQTNY